MPDSPLRTKQGDSLLADLLSTTDGQAWAQVFMRLFGDNLDKIDEGLMIAWFANAIETGRSAGLAGKQ